MGSYKYSRELNCFSQKGIRVEFRHFSPGMISVAPGAGVDVLPGLHRKIDRDRIREHGL